MDTTPSKEVNFSNNIFFFFLKKERIWKLILYFVVFNASDIKDLDLDPELGILDEEAEAWVGTVDKKILKKLKEKEIKRQEHIYEFIITEKHHCLTLKVMQKVWLKFKIH